jgi:hypothetical protein
MTNLSRDRLRAMQDRWQRDYDRLEAEEGDWMDPDREDHDMGSYVETMRNLATAIAMINGMITRRRRGDPPLPSAPASGRDTP